jgi:hypothetical protein
MARRLAALLFIGCLAVAAPAVRPSARPAPPPVALVLDTVEETAAPVEVAALSQRRPHKVMVPGEGVTPLGTGRGVRPLPSIDSDEAAVAEHVRVSRRERLVEKGGVYHFNNGRYGASFGESGVNFAIASPAPDPTMPRLRIELDRVLAGGAILATGGPAERLVEAAQGAIDYRRGAVTERYELKSNAMEQLFVVHAIPWNGAIEVAVRVESAQSPEEGTSGARLVFGGIEMSEAAVFDAAGRRLALEMGWRDGRMSLVVPAEWVAMATLPITIDPLVGGVTTIDAQTGGVWIRPSQAAYNSVNDQWLVVWNEQVGASSFDYDLYAQRVASNGTLSGGPIGVDTGAASGAYECAVAYSPTVNRFLIAWAGDPADNGTATDREIYGRMLNGGASTFFNAAAVLDGDALDDYNPRVAWGANRFYLCFTAVVSANSTPAPDWDIEGSFWTASMGFSATADVDPSSVDLANNANLAFHAGTSRHLVVWETSPSAAGGTVGIRDIRFRRLNATTSAFLGTLPATVVDQAAGDAAHASAAASGSRWLVVWDQFTTATTGTIRARRINTGGSFAGNSFQVQGNIAFYSGGGGWPAVGYAPATQEYFVVWHTYVSAVDAHSVRGRRVTLTNTLAGGQVTLIAANDTVNDGKYVSTALRTTNSTFLVSWWNSWDPGGIQFRRFQMP